MRPQPKVAQGLSLRSSEATRQTRGKRKVYPARRGLRYQHTRKNVYLYGEASKIIELRKALTERIVIPIRQPAERNLVIIGMTGSPENRKIKLVARFRTCVVFGFFLGAFIFNAT